MVREAMSSAKVRSQPTDLRTLSASTLRTSMPNEKLWYIVPTLPNTSTKWASETLRKS